MKLESGIIKPEYKRENHKNYMVIHNLCKGNERNKSREKIGETSSHSEVEKDAEFILSMICNNEIGGLLHVTEQIYNGEKELYYDISAKQPLAVLYEKKQMKKEDLLFLLRGIKKAIDAIEDYLIDVEYLVISPDYIFVDLSTKEVFLFVYPFLTQSSEESVFSFADYLLDKIQNDDQETVMCAYNFYRYIKEEQGDLSVAITRLLDEESVTSYCDHNRKREDGSMDLRKESKRGTSPSDDELDIEYVNQRDFYFDENEVVDNPWDEFKEDTKDMKGYRVGVRMIAVLAILGLIGAGGSSYCFLTYQMSPMVILIQKEVLLLLGLLAVSVFGLVGFGIRTLVSKKRMHRSRASDSVQIDTKKADMKEACLERMGANVIDSDRLDFLGDGKWDEPSCGSAPSSYNEYDGETVLIADEAYHEERVLIGKIKGRKREIDLSSFPFFVGKSAENVDYTIPDASVSRIHAKFSLRDDMVFLTDLNSTNATYKNGIRLQPNEMTLLEAGDEIVFGKVSFVYQ